MRVYFPVYINRVQLPEQLIDPNTKDPMVFKDKAEAEEFLSGFGPAQTEFRIAEVEI